MIKQQLIIPFFSILVISVIASPATILAQVDYCGTGTIPSKENPEVCVAICGDGTVMNKEKKCVSSAGFLDLTDNAWIGWGVLLAGIIAGIGIGISIWQQIKESQKRTHEIIQTYSSKITEITNKESTLKTKQDCALYAEQYLDTLEEIATLSLAGNFNRGIVNRTYRHVTDYFNNNFAYGYDLWWWYHKYIHGFNDDIMQERLWKVTKGSNIAKISTTIEDIFTPEEIQSMKDGEAKTIRETLLNSTTIEDLFTPEEIDVMETNGTIREKRKALLNYLRDDRWPDFRKLCRENDITEFKYNYKGLGAFDDSKKNWRVLPDLMYYNYEKIPDEDGLSKAEFVEIIRSYANDLSDFVEKEKKMCTPEDFEVYAEQFLETLEQIATLFRNKIIPTKAAASYFENKFSYGCNLWEWYHQIALKFSPNFYHALWAMNDKKIEEDNREQFKNENFSEFLNYYSNGNDVQAINQFKNENPDVLKIVTKISTKNIPGRNTRNNVDRFLIQQVQVMTDEQIIGHLKEYANNFSANERWRDFRWWCKDETSKSKITPFEEDPDEGLILPLRMWQAEYS